VKSPAGALDGFEHLVGFQRDCERQARQALGETAFQAAYHRGLQLPAADVLAYALQQPPEKPPAPAVSDGAPLTARQLQVARLIAGGRRIKEIAAELVISQRTAGKPRGAHPRQARLHLTSPGRRLGRRVTTRR
jgi:ATP/maltotriose-dependent transcriptional regulator MalT